MATAAVSAFFSCIHEGCISSLDTEIRRRPYHRNCGCAMHRSRCIPEDVSCNARVSYPVRRSWSGVSIDNCSTGWDATRASGRS